MDRLTSLLGGLDPMRRVFVVLATIVVFIAVLAIARSANAPRMELLYSGLDPAAAGEVIASLDQQGATYDVRGSAIYVDASRRDVLRMALAAEGKPASGGAGYEILDSLSGFGTTAQMFDAAFRRAIEGELARTISAAPHIRSARVHIAVPETRPFSRDVTASASVVVNSNGSRLSSNQARAFRYLVASAVDGLLPEGVTIIDSAGGIIDGGDGAGSDLAANTGDRATTLRQNAQRLLEARVGVGRAVVEVNVEAITESEQLVERRFDPDSRVAISTITEETTTSSRDARNGSVTVSGNLPDGDAGGAGNQSTSQDNGTREQINYEVSETQREVVRAPGDIKRLTVAVLVDGIREVQSDGTVNWSPRPDEELEALRELVSSAVGFDEPRGDKITLRSMEFPAPSEVGTSAPPPALTERLGLDVMQLVQVGILALVALVLGLFVVRPILSGAPRALPAAPERRDLPAPETTVLAGEISDKEPNMGSADRSTAIDGTPAIPAIDPGARLQQLTDGRSTETTTVLRKWMEDEEAPA